MPLPISRSALDRLGERLVAASHVTDDDYQLLQGVLAAYDEALASVQRQLEALGLAATGRLKTTGTLIDKLRRESSMRLKGMQDVAGLRTVVAGTHRDQDEVVARIVAAFVGASRPPKVTDRRTAPSSGYRAVHVVVFEAGLPVEVQVRTELQDAWAQAYERLADRWGRGIRYGEPPNEPESPSVGNLTRQQVVKIMAEISTMIDDFEQARDTLLDVEQVLALQSTEPDEDEHQALTTDRVEARDRVTTLEGLLRRGLALLEGAVTGEGG